MTLTPTYLIYRTGFAPTNGTSVQLQRLFQDSEEQLIHLMWESPEGGKTSVRWVIDARDWYYWGRPFGRLGRGLRRLRGLIEPLWWKGQKLNAGKLTKALSHFPLQPNQAYVVCFNEREADIAGQFWDAVGQPPFVLHIFDIFDGKLNEKDTPHFARLAREASHVFCLNSLIENECRGVGARSTSIFPLCSNLSPEPRPAMPGPPLKILMSGALYATMPADNKAIQLLSEAWTTLQDRFPGAELHYSGAQSAEIPANLRPLVCDHGLLPTEEYQRLLRRCHAAYVPVSHLRDTPLKFSIPSRIPDYLISGLPVIACTEEDTGIHEFFQSTPAECTRLVRTPDAFLSSMEEFAGNEQRWKRASLSATQFSSRTFALEPARRNLFEHLNAAGASGQIEVAR